MICKTLMIASVCSMFLTALPGLAETRAGNTIKDAVDPDCTAQKAAKGAAMKATVGVGNRCGVAETVRDVSGTDGKVDDLKEGVAPNPVKE